MSVTQRDLHNGRTVEEVKAAGEWDWSLIFGRLAVWLIILAIGPIWWGINGGFSVFGLRSFAGGFGSYGLLFYELVASWTFSLNVAAKVGLPTAQPVLAWGLVVASTVLQVVLIYRRLRKKSFIWWLVIIGILLSIYDLGTTWFGLGTVSWIQRGGPLVQSVVGFILTFGLETGIGFALKPLRKG